VASGTRHRRSRLGFTLIEILSVVAILALVAAVVVPNLGAIQARRLRAEAERLASHLELARQRAVMTGVPHRVAIDLDQAEYRLEWLGDPDGADDAAPAPAELDLSGNAPLPLSAPQVAERDFQPMPGMFGQTVVLEDPLVFEGLQTPEGWITRGDSYVAFDRDGTTSWTEIYLEDGSGQSIGLQVQPLDDRVRIIDGHE
jgi:prepilin-type N-terminal cleavage/methylation domain-containing protein